MLQKKIKIRSADRDVPKASPDRFGQLGRIAAASEESTKGDGFLSTLMPTTRTPPIWFCLTGAAKSYTLKPKTHRLGRISGMPLWKNLRLFYCSHVATASIVAGRIVQAGSIYLFIQLASKLLSIYPSCIYRCSNYLSMQYLSSIYLVSVYLVTIIYLVPIYLVSIIHLSIQYLYQGYPKPDFNFKLISILTAKIPDAITTKQFCFTAVFLKHTLIYLGCRNCKLQILI